MTFDLETLRFLPLFLIIPACWWLAGRLPEALGTWRAMFALGLRAIVITGVILALSGLRWGWFTDRVSVVYVLDQSDSISNEAKRAMVEYAVTSANRDRVAQRRDLVGLVAFAGEAQIEVPPFEAGLSVQLRPSLSDIRVDATNVEDAIDLAMAAMPPDARQRVVLITDGNQTSGQALRAATHAASRGVGIDVIPILTAQTGDVSLDRLDLPGQIDAGQPFSGRLIASYRGADAQASIRGQLTVTQSLQGEEQLVISEEVTLTDGKNVLPFQHRVEIPAAYSFEARFIPEQAELDRQPKNNRVSALAQVGGASRTLMIEPLHQAGQFASLAELLRREKIEVDVRTSNSAFTSLADLLSYDSVILANVPRAGGDSAETMVGLSEAQTAMLIQNTQQFGAGLLMIGGPDAFGAGGWSGTELEAAMPVDFDVKNSKIRAVGALMLVLDTSGSMSGQKLSSAKAAAREAVMALGAADFVGVISFDGETRETIPLQRVGDPRRMLPALARIGSGGGTVMYPAVALGYKQLAGIEAMVKHMVIVTDGRTQPDPFDNLVRRMRADGLTVSTIAVGDDADLPLLRSIATGGGGKFYQVRSPQALPKIVLRESRRVSKPLIFESEEGLVPRQVFPHVVLDGIDACPPITGLVLTTPKDSPLVQNLLMSPRPGDAEHPVLSVWTYGLGHTAAMTTDAGQRWAEAWSQWPAQQKFFAQLVRWLKRPEGGSGAFQVTSRWHDGEIEVVVNAIEKEARSGESLPMQGLIVDPELQSQSLELKQVAPGRYVGAVAAERSGSYFIRVLPHSQTGPLVSGVTVPFGAEYRAEFTNLAMLQSLAGLQPEGGTAGVLSAPLDGAASGPVPTNHFREGLPRRAAMRTAWPWLILASCLVFLGDVGNRRLALDLSRVRGWWSRTGASEPAAVMRLDRMEQLQNAKSAVKAGSSSARSGAPSAPPAGDVFGGALPADSQPRAKSTATAVEVANESEEGSQAYIDRLLAAKRRARHGKSP